MSGVVGIVLGAVLLVVGIPMYVWASEPIGPHRLGRDVGLGMFGLALTCVGTLSLLVGIAMATS